MKKKRISKVKSGGSVVKPCFILLLLIMVLSLSFLSLGGAKAKAGAAATDKYYTSIRVQQGDSLWSIAKRYAPEYADIKAYVEELEEINCLTYNQTLRVAQSLIVVYYR